jgi:hypothetical protein
VRLLATTTTSAHQRCGVGLERGDRGGDDLDLLYRSTDRLCRGGAPVKNLAHGACLHAGDNNAPSNAGIKQTSEELPHARLAANFVASVHMVAAVVWWTL